MATESVKIDTSVVAKVRKQKKKSGINVGKFFELAALEKIEREKKYLIAADPYSMNRDELNEAAKVFLKP